MAEESRKDQQQEAAQHHQGKFPSGVLVPLLLGALIAALLELHLPEPLSDSLMRVLRTGIEGWVGGCRGSHP